MRKTAGVLTGLIMLCSTNSFAATEVEAYFDAATNKLVIPHLVVNSQVYHASLSLIDAATLTFRADAETLLDLTPPAGTTLNPASVTLHGSWHFSVPQDTITFNADGTYRQFQYSVEANDPTCVRGQESGTYSWERSTGVLVVKVTQDANRDCGLSERGAIRRIYVDGANALRLIVTDSRGRTEQYPMVRSN